MSKVLIIFSVRDASEDYRPKSESYKSLREKRNNKVQLAHRDKNQNTSAYKICKENANIIWNADEDYIF
jgi:hypothetical protein